MKNVSKKLVGFDLDGVIIDHHQIKIQLAKDFGFRITPAQTDSDIMRTLMPEKIVSEIQHLLYYDPKFSLCSPLMRGARNALKKLQKEKTSFTLISRRKNPVIAKELLKNHGIWPNYFNESNSYFVIKIEDKNKKAKELGVTHYLDDEEIVITALKSVPHRFLFDHFQVLENSDFYKRVSSWPEFLKWL